MIKIRYSAFSNRSGVMLSWLRGLRCWRSAIPCGAPRDSWHHESRPELVAPPSFDVQVISDPIEKSSRDILNLCNVRSLPE